MKRTLFTGILLVEFAVALWTAHGLDKSIKQMLNREGLLGKNGKIDEKKLKKYMETCRNKQNKI